MYDKACPIPRMDGWLETGIGRRPDSRFRCTEHRAVVLVLDENLLVMEIDMIGLTRGLDLAVFETSGRQSQSWCALKPPPVRRPHGCCGSE